MKIIESEVEAFGNLHTSFGLYLMLKKFPNLFDVPVSLRETGYMSVYVLDHDGFAKNIYVNSHNTIIVPFTGTELVTAKFEVEDE